ncbi:hypothetical protein Droror1_Dr00011189 [Drosera rotundifolia]
MSKPTALLITVLAFFLISGFASAARPLTDQVFQPIPVPKPPLYGSGLGLDVGWGQGWPWGGHVGVGVGPNPGDTGFDVGWAPGWPWGGHVSFGIPGFPLGGFGLPFPFPFPFPTIRGSPCPWCIPGSIPMFPTPLPVPYKGAPIESQPEPTTGPPDFVPPTGPVEFTPTGPGQHP